MLQTQTHTEQTTTSPKLTLVCQTIDGNVDLEDQADDVSLPPTPAIQPSWSLIASQPARPRAPTPNSDANKSDLNLESNSIIEEPVVEEVERTKHVTDKNITNVKSVEDVSTEDVKGIQGVKTYLNADDEVLKDLPTNLLNNLIEGSVTVTHITDEGIKTIKTQSEQEEERRKSSTVISTAELNLSPSIQESLIEANTDKGKKIVMKISETDDIIDMDAQSIISAVKDDFQEDSDYKLKEITHGKDDIKEKVEVSPQVKFQEDSKADDDTTTFVPDTKNSNIKGVRDLKSFLQGESEDEKTKSPIEEKESRNNDKDSKSRKSINITSEEENESKDTHDQDGQSGVIDLESLLSEESEEGVNSDNTEKNSQSDEDKSRPQLERSNKLNEEIETKKDQKNRDDNSDVNKLKAFSHEESDNGVNSEDTEEIESEPQKNTEQKDSKDDQGNLEGVKDIKSFLSEESKDGEKCYDTEKLNRIQLITDESDEDKTKPQIERSNESEEEKKKDPRNLDNEQSDKGNVRSQIERSEESEDRDQGNLEDKSGVINLKSFLCEESKDAVKSEDMLKKSQEIELEEEPNSKMEKTDESIESKRYQFLSEDSSDMVESEHTKRKSQEMESEEDKDAKKDTRNLDDRSGVRGLKSFLESKEGVRNEEKSLFEIESKSIQINAEESDGDTSEKCEKSKEEKESSISKYETSSHFEGEGNNSSKISPSDDSCENNEDNDAEIVEVEMQKISDEELVCLNNLKKITGLFKAKISNNQGSKYESRYETRTYEKVEETQETVALELGNVKSAIQKKKVIVIQQTIITIVQSVSNWLDRVEYKISTIKRIKTVKQKKAELKNIKEEIEVIE